jgi:hypothetical protein
MDEPFPKGAAQKSLSATLLLLQETCTHLSLPTSAEKAKNVNTALQDGIRSQKLGEECDRLSEVIALEMQSHLFMYIEPTKVAYYSNPQLFGDEVSVRFPSTIFDVDEAGKCLALNRGTACVFHLMRVLEIGLYTLGKELKVPNLQENWHNAIEQIESAIQVFEKAGPGQGATEKDRLEWRDKKQFYSEAATHFMYVKEAWRNRTAHSGQMYTDEKAHQIFENVKGFMQLLATRMGEKPL